ncbi:unnamed protein product [Arabidopsis arenosa]|uniref:Transposase-associated domain-containing protein n=1 Tax=Arabidopsis arenosa TaxID=38785 RepID=A0A8S1ZNR7_ARAAE|nr:unnamed protein product [Arabidopsis arenosa]
MDKSWITKHRISQDYINGVKEFLDFAFGYSKTDMIKCPCQRCFLVKYKNRTEIEGDLVCHGFLPTYTNWYLHGEELDFQEQEVRLEHESDDDHVENPTMNLLGDVFPSMSNSFSKYNINGFKFRIIERDQDLKTQNSGIFVSAETISYASSRDINPRSGNVSYYGKLTEILELNYYDSFRVVLFKCKWVDTRDARGFKKDQFGHSMVNFSRLIHTGSGEEDEPYVLASQARLVYYVEDPQEKDWSVVVHVQPRDLYDMEDPTSSDEIPPQVVIEDPPIQSSMIISDNVSDIRLVRQIEDLESSQIPSDLYDNMETDSQAPPPLGPELASGKWRVRVIGSLSNDLNILPINYTDWRKVPNYRKEMAWKVIQKKFWFDNPRRRKKYVLSALGVRCRDLKQRIWMKYRRNTIEEAFEARPGLIPEDQWKEFVEMQFTDKAKEEETGKEPNRAELFIASRTRSDGSLLSNEARICDVV